MKNLAPDIERHRLLIEAKYARVVTKEAVERYLTELPAALDLRIYSAPVVYSPGGQGKAINQGFDGFVALVDSGISIYVWETAKFLSTVIYSCKRFEKEKALSFTEQFFSTTHCEHLSF